ncbi:MAG: hypothetical protein IPH75_15370 [bacterium]|nr:hypothetical protein [bacterium]
MKHLLLIVMLVVCLVAAQATAGGVGSAFGTMTTASAMGQGKANFGAGVGIADATTVFGTLEYGLSRYTDGRLKLGLYDADDDLKFTIGADLKWQFWDMNQGRREPFDMAFGGFFEYLSVENFSIFQVGAMAIGSYPIALNNGGTLSPYAKLNVRLESLSWDDAPAGYDDSESDIRFGLNGGVCWQATSVIGLFGEFQLDGNDGIFLGLNFNIQ